MSTVLVVDDSSTFREMISDLLKQVGFAVLLASDGAEAKDKILASPPDLVVMDIVMPNMNGYELCRWVKGNAPTKDVPVVICSSKNEEFDHYWAMKQGADAYVSKPFQPNDLIQAVQKLLAP